MEKNLQGFDIIPFDTLLLRPYAKPTDLVIEDWPNAVRIVYRPISGASTESVRLQSQPESQPGSQPESLSLASRILNVLVSGAKSRSAIAFSLGQKTGSGQLKKIIVELLTQGMLERTIPEKPNSRLQKYRLTERGMMVAGQLSAGRGEL